MELRFLKKTLAQIASQLLIHAHIISNNDDSPPRQKRVFNPLINNQIFYESGIENSIWKRS